MSAAPSVEPSTTPDATLPVLSLQYRGETIEGQRGRTCWRPPDREKRECLAEGKWQDVDTHTEVSSNETLTILVEADAPPTRMSVYSLTEPGLDSLDDRDRTAPDPFNGAGCSFNREIPHVVLTLESEDRRYIETFRLDPPSLRVSLPIPEDTVSESTDGPLPPGPYSHRIVAVTVDGVEKQLASRVLGVINISDGPSDPDAPVVLLHHHENPRSYATSSPEYIAGRLRVQGGCMYIRNGEIPVWPSGYGVREKDGRIEIIDRRGTVVARENQHAILKGRPVSVTEPLGLELTRAMPLWCPPGNFWIVDAPTGASGKSILPDARPSTDWKSTEVSGSDMAGGFSVILSPGWGLSGLQGIDPLVGGGGVVGGGVQLVYDDDGLDARNTTSHDAIGELEAEMLLPTFVSDGTTGEYFESLRGNRFNLISEDLTPEHQRRAMAVFLGIDSISR